MKKFLSLLMALTMLMACTACFGSAESASDPAAYDGSEVNITCTTKRIRCKSNSYK